MWKEVHRYDCVRKVKALWCIFKAPMCATPPVVGDHGLSITLRSLLYILSDFQQAGSIHEYKVQHHGQKVMDQRLFLSNSISNRLQSSQSSWTSTTSCFIKFLLVTLCTLRAMILWHVFTSAIPIPFTVYSKAMTLLSGGSLLQAWKRSCQHITFGAFFKLY